MQLLLKRSQSEGALENPTSPTAAGSVRVTDEDHSVPGFRAHSTSGFALGEQEIL
jgi:hypothetical protein